MNPQALFVAESGAVRAFWRIVFFMIAVVVGVAILMAIAYPIAIALGIADFGRATRVPVTDMVSVGGILIGTYAVSRIVEGRLDGIWTRVGLGAKAFGWRKLAIGAVAGTAGILAPAGALIAAGRFSLDAAPAAGSWIGASGTALAVLTLAALVEELMMRGYLLSVLRESAGTKAAIIITSIAFGLLHLGNPDPSVIGIAMVMLAGYFLAYIRIATGSLYAAWIAHLAWNFAQAAILHAPVSGLPLPQPGYTLVDHGPQWLTGGTWGPEGGLAAAAGMLLTTFLLMKLLHTSASGETVAAPVSISEGSTNE